MAEGKFDDRFLKVAALVTLFGFVLRAYGLSSQPPSGDDISVAVSAINYVEAGNLGPTMWNHPDLRNVLVYLSMWLSGGSVWGLKAVSLTLGTLSILLLSLTARRILINEEAALMAAFFLAIDPLHIDFSRQAVHEVYMAFFSLSGILLALKFRDNTRPASLIFSGIFFGLGLASKWYVAFPLFVTFSFLIYCILKDYQTNILKKIPIALFVTSALVILPVTIYLLTFIPWFQRGYGISEWLLLQKAMYIETTIHSGYNPYGFEIDHRAYLWFIKPVAFADFIFSEGKPIVLLGISNPFIWLLTIPSTVYVTYKGIREKADNYFFLFFLFWLSYIPFLVTKRPIWAHTAFSVIPFSFMAVSYSIFDILRDKRYRKIVLAIYFLFVIIVSIPLYLLATGKGLEIDCLKPFVELYKPQNER